MQLPEKIIWHGKTYPIPDADKIEKWVEESVCETPDGDTVKPDHPDSWLNLLGMI